MTPIAESSATDLYNSAVAAFPHTTKRQHVTHSVEIKNAEFVPFVGMHTLFARCRSQNEGKEYNTIILVKGVEYLEGATGGAIAIEGADGQEYWLLQPSLHDNDVLVRCSCPDFSWRFNYYDHLDKSLYGVKRAKYEAKINPGSANPQKLPGMCKHLMKFADTLNSSGILAD